MTDTLEADLATILNAELTGLGYPSAPGTPWRELYYQRFNLKKRLVEARPRTVHVVPGIVVPPELQAGYEMVRAKLQNGEDVRPHLSRKLKEVDFRDAMLNDWGIIHFHLGTVLQGDGFMVRSGPLLFAKIEPNDAYLLGVGTHADFTTQALVQTLVDHFPAAMARYAHPNIIDVELAATDDEIKKLRRIGATTPVRAADGTFYMGLGGGGMSLTGWPTAAVIEANKLQKALNFLPRELNRKLETIATNLENQGKVVPDNLNFSFRRDGADLVLTETNTDVIVTRFPNF